MPLLEYLSSGSPSLKKKFKAVVDACRQIPLPGANITVHETPQGPVFNAVFDPSEAGSHPFKVTTTIDQDTGLFLAKVELQSDLLKSLRPSDNLSITGLDSWFPLIANDVIALFISFNTVDGILTPGSATIQSYGQGNTSFNPTLAAWIENAYVYDDGDPTDSKQAGASVLLAQSVPDEDGKPSVTQKCFSHLVLEDRSIDGRPGKFVMPSPYGRYQT